LAYFKDMREHLAALEQAGLLVRVNRPINKDTELNPLVRLQFRGLPERERKAFLFEHVTDLAGRRFSIPVVVACLAGSRRIYGAGLQCDPAEIAQRWTKARENPIEPALFASGPVHEEVHRQEELDRPGMGLEEFPIPISTPGFDAAPFTSCSQWITKDPETGVRNIGTYRGMMKSRTRLGMNAGGGQHITQHWRKWQKLGKPMPAVAVIGAPPNVAYASVIKIPYGIDEYAVAGGLAGEPVPVVKAKTVDIEVPANAEIALEGYIRTDVLEPEAPFGEFTGYMDPQQLNPFFEITCVTHRKNPLWVTMLSQFPPSESSMIRTVGSEGNAISYLRGRGFDSVKDVGYHEASGGWGLCCIQIGKPKDGEISAILEACTASPSIRAKTIVVVDDDIDPRNVDAIVWAITYRLQPHRDMKVKMMPLISADWSAFPPGTGDPGGFQTSGGDSSVSVMLMDATRKWPYPPVSLPPKDIMEHVLPIWEELGLPRLELRRPWYGYDLGWWTEAEKAAGKLAIEGRYYETGKKMERERIPAPKDESKKS
jgi:4-hydroxy-3-polyprenylbenzoate decarboxylase